MICKALHLKMVDPLYGASGQPCLNFVRQSKASICDLSFDRNKHRPARVKKVENIFLKYHTHSACCNKE